MRPGRHGSMSSSEFEGILTRNSNFLSVRRAGSGDGLAGLHCAITGKYILGIGGGMLPEYSFYSQPQWNCPCSPGAECRTKAHGTGLVRGWRNILFELVTRGRLKVKGELIRVMGEEEAADAIAKLMLKAPMHNPAPAWNHSQIVTATS